MNSVSWKVCYDPGGVREVYVGIGGMNSSYVSLPCHLNSVDIAYMSPGLSPASGFEHPASTLPTRFPAALGIRYGSACGVANACALVYVAA